MPPPAKKTPTRKPPAPPPRPTYLRTTARYADIYLMPQATLSVFRKQGMSLDNPVQFMEELNSRPGTVRANLTRLHQFVKAKCTTIDQAEAIAFAQAPSPTLHKHSSIPGVSVVPRRGQAPIRRLPVEDDTSDPDESIGQASKKFDAMGAEGLELELRRLKHEIDRAYDTYETLSQTDPIGAAASWRTWKEMLAQFTAISKMAPEIELRAKTVVLVSDVRDTWMRAMAEAKTIMDSVPDRVSSHPRACCTDPISLKTLLIEELSRVMTAFKRGEVVKSSS